MAGDDMAPSAEPSEEEGDEPAPLGRPTPALEGSAGLEEVDTKGGFSQFPMVDPNPTGGQGQFGTAQLQDPNLTQAWRDVQVIDGKLQ